MQLGATHVLALFHHDFFTHRAGLGDNISNRSNFQCASSSERSSPSWLVWVQGCQSGKQRFWKMATCITTSLSFKKSPCYIDEKRTSPYSATNKISVWLVEERIWTVPGWTGRMERVSQVWDVQEAWSGPVEKVYYSGLV